MSLRNKVALVIFLASLSSLLVLTAAHMIYHIAHIRTSLKNEIETIATMIARSSRSSLEFNDPVSAGDILATFCNDERIVFSAIYRSNGTILGSMGKPVEKSQNKGLLTRILGGGFLNKKVPVFSHGKKIGEVEVHGNLAMVEQRIKSEMHIVGTVAIVSLLIATLFSMPLEKIITRPILMLASTVQKIAESRDYSIRATKTSDDEIGSLVDSFNAMISTIEERTFALRQSEQSYRELVEHQQEGLGVVDLDECFVFANPAAHEIFGVPQGELTGRSLREFVDDKNFDLIRKQTAIRPTCGRTTYELEIIRPDGKRRVILVTASPRFDSQGNFKGTFGVFRDITDRKIAEEKLRQSLEEKEVLLREIHHRVKNNLQMVSSMLYLQSRGLADSAALEILKESQGRIRSMALIHETLYRSGNLARVNMSQYISSLVSSLWASYDSAGRLVSIETHVADVDLSIDTAIPCGLVVNELLTNSIKHGFDSTGGKIRVELSKLSDSEYELIVEDNGVGLPPGLDIDRCSTLGLRLVKSLVEQMQGTLKISNIGGAQFRVRFADQTKGGRVLCQISG